MVSEALQGKRAKIPGNVTQIHDFLKGIGVENAEVSVSDLD